MVVQGTISAAADAGGDWSCTSTGHGLVTGDKIFVMDGTGATGLNTSWGSMATVTVTDANVFKLDDTTVGGTYDANTAWWGVPEQYDR